MVDLTVTLPPPAAGADAVRRAVAEVLARPEYAEATPSLAARIRGWVGEQLGRLLDAVLGTGQASLLGSLLLVAAVAAVVVLAVRFARSVRRDPGTAVVTADGVGRAPADWVAEADEHEGAGRYREAVRCRYRALVAALAVAGVVDEAPGRTAGEYLAETRRRRPEVGEEVAAVTAVFEAAWYGHAPVDRAILDQVRDRAAAARTAVAGTRSGDRPVGAAAAGGAGP